MRDKFKQSRSIMSKNEIGDIAREQVAYDSEVFNFKDGNKNSKKLQEEYNKDQTSQKLKSSAKMGSLNASGRKPWMIERDKQSLTFIEYDCVAYRFKGNVTKGQYRIPFIMKLP